MSATLADAPVSNVNVAPRNIAKNTPVKKPVQPIQGVTSPPPSRTLAATQATLCRWTRARYAPGRPYPTSPVPRVPSAVPDGDANLSASSPTRRHQAPHTQVTG